MRRLVLGLAAVAACAGPEATGPGAGGGTAALAAGGDPALVAPDAFFASFSPDGTQLAYGRMPDGSGITVLDLRTGVSRPLVAPGKVPAWSPDGKRLAYVVGDQRKGLAGEEVWLVGRDGTGARRLTEGAGGPSWTPDGASVVAHAAKPDRMVAIPADRPGAPSVFYDGPVGLTPAVSPDATLVGIGADQELQVYERQSRKKVFAWPTPGTSALSAAFSPDGKRLAFGGNFVTPIGLWVIDVEQRKAVQVAVGHYFRPVWSPDSQTLVFDLREPKRKALWRMSRKLVDRCLERAAIPSTDVHLGAGICPEALRTPAKLGG